MDVTKAQMERWIKDLKWGCCGGMCPGPDAQYLIMQTCRVCQVIKDMRYAIDGVPRLEGHPGYSTRHTREVAEAERQWRERQAAQQAVSLVRHFQGDEP